MRPAARYWVLRSPLGSNHPSKEPALGRIHTRPDHRGTRVCHGAGSHPLGARRRGAFPEAWLQGASFRPWINFSDLNDPGQRQRVIADPADHTKRLVNAFRHRLEALGNQAGCGASTRQPLLADAKLQGRRKAAWMRGVWRLEADVYMGVYTGRSHRSRWAGRVRSRRVAGVYPPTSWCVFDSTWRVSGMGSPLADFVQQAVGLFRVQVPLKPHEYAPHLVRPAEFHEGIGDRVAVLQLQQW